MVVDNLGQVKILQAQSMLYEPSRACKTIPAISASYGYIRTLDLVGKRKTENKTLKAEP
jgi:hypothetical protein